MPVFPAQGGSRNTWGTELRNFFSPYFTLTTGLFVTASVPGWAIDAGIAWTQIVKTTASLADINNHDHSTLTSIGTNNHMTIDAFIASASTSPGASMIPITTTTSMLVLPGNVLLPNTAALKIKNATGSDWYSVVKKSSDAVYVGDVDKFATGHIYFSGTTSQNFIHAVSQTGADTVVYHGGNLSSLSHTNIADIGSNTHAQIDTYISNAGAWVDYSTTSTVVGWSAFGVKTIRYAVVNKIVHVVFNIQGTSNATTATFTLPTAMNASAPQLQCLGILGEDNGALLTLPAKLIVSSGSNVFSFFKDGSGAAWTATGTKAILGEFFYEIA